MTRWRDYFLILVVAVLCALFVRGFVITAYKVPTGSMQPSLKPGDFIFSSRISYSSQFSWFTGKSEPAIPERGDLVVFSYPTHPEVNYVKRVVGLPGDHIQIRKGRLFINEIALEYKILQDELADNPNTQQFDVFEESFQGLKWKVIFQKNEEKDFGPLVVPPDELFLMGDNRDASDDSRYWGTVPLSKIAGKVVIIWLSLDWQKKWGGERYPSVRWNRVFNSVH